MKANVDPNGKPWVFTLWQLLKSCDMVFIDGMDVRTTKFLPETVRIAFGTDKIVYFFDQNIQLDDVGCGWVTAEDAVFQFRFMRLVPLTPDHIKAS